MINILNRKTVKYSQNTWKGAGGGVRDRYC